MNEFEMDDLVGGWRWVFRMACLLTLLIVHFFGIRRINNGGLVFVICLAVAIEMLIA